MTSTSLGGCIVLEIPTTELPVDCALDEDGSCEETTAPEGDEEPEGEEQDDPVADDVVTADEHGNEADEEDANLQDDAGSCGDEGHQEEDDEAPSEVDEESFEPPETPSVPCDVEIEPVASARPGGQIDIRWNPDTVPSTQVYISVLSDNGAHYYHHGITSNDGHFAFELPRGLDPENETYLTYVETAENDERSRQCWDYQDFDVLEPICDATLEAVDAVYRGGHVELHWEPGNIPTSQVYVAVLSDNGARYYHHGFAPNDGHFVFEMPHDVDPDTDSYLTYIETAEDDQRTSQCWAYGPFDVM